MNTKEQELIEQFQKVSVIFTWDDRFDEDLLGSPAWRFDFNCFRKPLDYKLYLDNLETKFYDELNIVDDVKVVIDLLIKFKQLENIIVIDEKNTNKYGYTIYQHIVYEQSAIVDEIECPYEKMNLFFLIQKQSISRVLEYLESFKSNFKTAPLSLEGNSSNPPKTQNPIQKLKWNGKTKDFIAFFAPLIKDETISLNGESDTEPIVKVLHSMFEIKKKKGEDEISVAHLASVAVLSGYGDD